MFVGLLAGLTDLPATSLADRFMAEFEVGEHEPGNDGLLEQVSIRAEEMRAICPEFVRIGV